MIWNDKLLVAKKLREVAEQEQLLAVSDKSEDQTPRLIHFSIKNALEALATSFERDAR